MAHPGSWIVRIPERDKPYLKRLLELSPSSATLLVSQLGAGRPTLSAREFAGQISLPDVDSASVEGIVGVLVSLLLTAETRQLPPQELASEVVRAAREQGIVSTDDGEARLRQFLTADTALAVTARAIALSSEHERGFTSARILTDLRPIFVGVPPQPKAAVVTHTLRIESHKEEGHTSEFFGLDLADLRSLKDTIERAIKKEESLRASVHVEGLSILESSDD